MEFSKTLVYWYLQNKRDLPWRQNNDPYFVWLSEIMLQQTRIAQGLSYFLKFKEAFPTVHELAKADEQQVLKLWQGLGYYSRARNLHSTAKYVSQELAGEFPNTYQDLKKLKGVGDYTASAIASISFSQPHAVVDGNVYRVLARYFGVHTPINSTKGIKEFKVLAQSLLNLKDPGTYNQAIMEFGALQCKPQSPNCDSCPLSTSCMARQKNWVSVLPMKEKKIKIKKRYFHYLVFVTKNNKTVLEQRKGKGIWQGLYQFPLIELPQLSDNVLESAEFMELVPNKARVKALHVEPIVHKLTHQHLYTRFWKIELDSLDRASVHFNDFNQYPVPALIAKFMANTSVTDS